MDFSHNVDQQNSEAEVTDKHSAAAPYLHTQIITTREKFDELEDEWEALVEKAGGSVFQSFYWLNAWWKHYGSDRELHIILFKDNDKLVGIAPFYYDVSGIFGVEIARFLRFIGSTVPEGNTQGAFINYSVSDYLDVIVDPEYEQHVVDCLLAELEQIENNYSKVILQETTPASWIRRNLLTSLENTHWRYTLHECNKCPVLYIDEENREENLQAFINSSKSRRKLHRMMKAESNFKVRILDNQAEIDNLFPRFVELYQSRWNAMGYPGTFNDPRHFDFMQEVIRKMYLNERLWIVVVENIAGDVIAFDINLLQGNRVYIYLGSFDHTSKYSKFSPGNACQLYGIIQAYESGIRELHFLRGDEEYKYHLANGEIDNLQVAIDSPRHISPPTKMILRCNESWQNLKHLIQRELIVMSSNRKQFGNRSFAHIYLKNLSYRLRQKRLAKKHSSGQAQA